MRLLAGLLLTIVAAAVTGCGPDSAAIDGREIARVVIHDLNWERGVTTTYTVTPTQIAVTDDSAAPSTTTVTLTTEQTARVRALFDRFDRLYPGHHADASVADGVIIDFAFHFRDGSVVTTSLNNIAIDPYADLTEYVSSLVDPDIQYHQYDMKRI